MKFSENFELTVCKKSFKAPPYIVRLELTRALNIYICIGDKQDTLG